MTSLLEGFYDVKKEKKKIDLKEQFSIINIPSKGIFYPSKKKSFLVKYLTAREEHVLTDDFLMESGMGIELVLASVILDDFPAGDLLLSDYQAILMYLRSTAYGDTIDLLPTCPHCQKENEYGLKMSSLEFRKPEYEPDKDGNYTLSIPELQLEIKTKPLTLSDEISSKNDASDDDYITYRDGSEEIKIKKTSTLNLISQIREINGETDKTIIKKVVRNLPKKIVAQLKDFVKKNQVGVEEEIVYECPFCSNESKQIINMGYDFLKLPAKYKESILEEIFLITYYGRGITMQDANSMPVYERKWHIRRIKEEIDKKNKAEKDAVNKAKRSSK